MLRNGVRSPMRSPSMGVKCPQTHLGGCASRVRCLPVHACALLRPGRWPQLKGLPSSPPCCAEYCLTLSPQSCLHVTNLPSRPPPSHALPPAEYCLTLSPQLPVWSSCTADNIKLQVGVVLILGASS